MAACLRGDMAPTNIARGSGEVHNNEQPVGTGKLNNSGRETTRAVVNGRVGRVLARPIFAQEETTPNKLTFTIYCVNVHVSFAKGPKFTTFCYLLSFLKK